MLRWLVLSLVALCVGCASPAPDPTPQQTGHVFDLDGTIQLEDTTIRYVVPEDRCLLDPDRPLEGVYYDLMSEIIGDDGDVFALFVECSQLELYRTDLQAFKEFEHFGAYYFAREDDGSVMRMSISRAFFATAMATMSNDDVDDTLDDVAEKTGEITGDPTASLESEYFESTGHTTDAAYFSFAMRSTTFGTEYPTQGAMGTTLVYGYPIGLILIRSTEASGATETLDRNIRTLIEAFLDANPDSDT
jgi:hypothetical protein